MTGLNVLLDEAQVPPTLWATAPRQISVALTNACDLSCPYCYAPKIPDALDFERLSDWLGELDVHGCLGLGFGGGEPTLYRRFTELCHSVAQNTGLAVTFTTHAHHLTDALLTDLPGSVHFVRVSMDGVGETYESLRNRSFAALQLRLQSLRRFVSFGINFVVNSRTLPDIDAAARLADEVGASELLLLPEQPVLGRGGIDGRTIRGLRRWAKLYQGKVPLTISEAESDEFPICNPLAGGTGASSLRTHRCIRHPEAVIVRQAWRGYRGWWCHGSIKYPANASGGGLVMKIWYGYGSEHSMNLVMIGQF
jgi:MoaA/NifB/PqqE/SkfB family radical SAM enzyme